MRPSILRENVEARLVGDDEEHPDLFDFIEDYLSFNDPDAWHKPHVRAGHSDGMAPVPAARR